MKQSELATLVSQWKSHPSPGRFMILWPFPMKDLKGALPNGISISLDLLTLSRSIQPLPTPANTGKTIRSKLESELARIHQQYSGNCILLVENSWLLARYKIPLTPFYDYFIEDGHMVIMILPTNRPSLPIKSGYLFYDSLAAEKYLEQDATVIRVCEEG